MFTLSWCIWFCGGTYIIGCLIHVWVLGLVCVWTPPSNVTDIYFWKNCFICSWLILTISIFDKSSLQKQIVKGLACGSTKKYFQNDQIYTAEISHRHFRYWQWQWPDIKYRLKSKLATIFCYFIKILYKCWRWITSLAQSSSNNWTRPV